MRWPGRSAARSASSSSWRIAPAPTATWVAPPRRRRPPTAIRCWSRRLARPSPTSSCTRTSGYGPRPSLRTDRAAGLFARDHRRQPENPAHEFEGAGGPTPNRILASSTPGTVGPGSQAHITLELINKLAGISIVHVPYRIATQALPDLISGDLQVGFNYIPTFVPGGTAGHDPRARGHQLATRERFARCSDGRRIGLPGIRGHRLERAFRAGRNTARDRRQGQCGCERLSEKRCRPDATSQDGNDTGRAAHLRSSRLTSIARTPNGVRSSRKPTSRCNRRIPLALNEGTTAMPDRLPKKFLRHASSCFRRRQDLPGRQSECALSATAGTAALRR